MKKIIHVDMDYFYAQVEILDKPELKNFPVAVGGLPGTRSVLCTSNYIARKFGVKSAMPTDFAIKLCPHLVVISPNFYKYEKASSKIFDLLSKYSELIEPVSLDEAYIDVSHHDNPKEVARKIKEDIFNLTGLTASVGLAPNKFLAKIASDYKKPNGLFFLHEKDIYHFIQTLPVKNIPGVGSKTTQVLKNLGINYCSDIINVDPNILYYHLGKYAFDLINFCNGIDERPVESDSERKSLGVETTFIEDKIERDNLKKELMELYDCFKERLENHLQQNPNTIIQKQFIKIRYSDFRKSQAESTLPITINHQDPLAFETFFNLFNHIYEKNISPVRLLGLGVRFKIIKKSESKVTNPQLNFFDIIYKSAG